MRGWRTILILALVTALIILSGRPGGSGRGGNDVCPGQSRAEQVWDGALHWWAPERYPPACRRLPGDGAR